MEQPSGSVTEERFAGLSFGQACEMLFAECKSSAPDIDGFQNLISYVRDMHEALGLEFKAEEYWNTETVSGTFAVWPREILQWQGPDLSGGVTRESISALRDLMVSTARMTETYRANVDTISRNAQRRSRDGMIDPNMLTRAVNTAPIFVPEASDDDEDDFL